ncbi:MAG: flagellar motor switch protein FliN [Marmoricola sp.]|nr:flagellar motor switch protein FliN [Marmoricola sp.]
MTMTTHSPDLALAASVAAAVADVVPAVRPLGVGSPQAGEEQAYVAFPGAVIARVVGSTEGHLALLVGPDLVSAMASGPGGPLSLASALQPALDAAARVLGARIDAGVSVEASSLGATLGPAHTVVPLLDGTPAAAVLVSDALLGGAPDASAATPAFLPDFGQSVPNGGAAGPRGPRRGLELLNGVDMELTVELGRTRMAVRELLSLSPGDVIELDRAAGSPADLLVNGRLIARGEVVVVDEDFGLRITEILESSGS